MDRQQAVNRQTLLDLARRAGNTQLVRKLDPPKLDPPRRIRWDKSGWAQEDGAIEMIWAPVPGFDQGPGPSPAAPAGGE